MKKICIVTCVEDLHTAKVAALLREEWGCDPIILEREKYGSDWVLSATINSDTAKSVIETRTGAYIEGQIGAIWNRRDFTAETTKTEESPESRYVAMQAAIHVNGVLRYMGNSTPVMNSPVANFNANSKFLQAALALKHGFKVPKSFFGGSPSVANVFLNSISESRRISIKPLESIHLRTSDGKIYAHYNSIFRRRGEDELGSLRQCPVILQEFIEKRLELRVTLVGDEVYAASIDTSQASDSAKVDWRHYDWANTPYRVHSIDRGFKEKIRNVASDIGIVYGAFDLILGIDGEMYFLEVNPQGQWLWIEDLTDLPISRSVARWLYTNGCER
jgi:glutathione synthase/RimK-type ligase-like ATP-grasp enzyme